MSERVFFLYFSRVALLFRVIMHSYDCSFTEDLISSLLRSQSVHSSLTEDLPVFTTQELLEKWSEMICISLYNRGCVEAGCGSRDVKLGFQLGLGTCITEAPWLPVDSECAE